MKAVALYDYDNGIERIQYAIREDDVVCSRIMRSRWTQWVVHGAVTRAMT